LNRCRVGHLVGCFAWPVPVNFVAFIMDAHARAYGAA